MEQRPRIALQTFTVRKFMQSPAAIESCFARMSELGLTAVELAYIKLQREEIDAVERASKQHGITIGSTQITFNFLDQQRDWVLDFHRQLGCSITSVSVLPLLAICGSRDRLLRFAQRLDTLGQFYRQQGIQLCYHHHDFEFRRYGKDVGLDLLLENTSPDNVGLELDTYWTARGGRSPQDVISDLGGRVKVVHLRDFKLRWKRWQLAPVDTAVGCGNLDFKRIVDSCIKNNVQYMPIEQATAKPFEQVSKSLDHLKNLGYEDLI